MPDDLLDPMEPKLARRVRSFSDQAVRPIDAAAISRGAVRARRSRVGGLFGTSTRLGWVAAAGLLVAAVGGAAWLGAGRLGPVGSATPSVATTDAASAACTPDDVDAAITGVEGAAGSRYATIELRNTSGVTCTMEKLARPELVDGDGTVLMDGAPLSGIRVVPIKIGPGEVLLAVVHLSNYCGPAPTSFPVTIVIVASDGAAFVASRGPLLPTDTSIVPPCNGDSQPALIAMQPWGLAPE